MKVIDSDYNDISDFCSGRARGAAEVRKIVSAIIPISKKVNSTTLLHGLSATCHNLSHQEIRPSDYALGRRELLQDASDIAWAIAAVADKADMPGLLSVFVAILGKLE